MKTKDVQDREPCGCIGLGSAVHFCPLHAQAEGMRAMLTKMADFYANACNCALSTGYTCMVHQARALLRAVEPR